MDILFLIAIFMLPFDNLFFAPSVGWATITPIIFFVYVIFNYRYFFKIIKKYKSLFLLIFLFFFLSLLDFLLVGYNLNEFLSTIFTLFLGICNLVAFEIYFVQKEKDLTKVKKVLIFSYTLSLLYGWIQFLAIKFSLNSLLNIFIFLSKRSYLNVGRVQFSFTEPSFIGMHIFGVLLPLYFIKKDKKIMRLIILFAISNLIFDSSLRFLLDILVVFCICVFLYFIKKKRYLLIGIILIISLVTINLAASSNPRIKNVLDKGIYADSSLASRYFRIKSGIYGYFDDPLHFVIGYGFGNSILPMRKGYQRALSEYKNPYLGEVISIGSPNYYSGNASFCFYTRLISEGGLIIFTLFFMYIFEKFKKSNFAYKKELLLLFIYLYLQFDSYAFYTLWILLFIYTNMVKEKENVTCIKNISL